MLWTNKPNFSKSETRSSKQFFPELSFMYLTLRSRISRTRCKFRHKLRNNQNIPTWSPNFWVSYFTHYLCSSFPSHLTSQVFLHLVTSVILNLLTCCYYIFLLLFIFGNFVRIHHTVMGLLFHQKPNTPPTSCLYGLPFSHSAYNSELWNYVF